MGLNGGLTRRDEGAAGSASEGEGPSSEPQQRLRRLPRIQRTLAVLVQSLEGMEVNVVLLWPAC
jgi:hypothetical protein